VGDMKKVGEWFGETKSGFCTGGATGEQWGAEGFPNGTTGKDSFREHTILMESSMKRMNECKKRS